MMIQASWLDFYSFQKCVSTLQVHKICLAYSRDEVPPFRKLLELFHIRNAIHKINLFLDTFLQSLRPIKCGSHDQPPEDWYLLHPDTNFTSTFPFTFERHSSIHFCTQLLQFYNPTILSFQYLLPSTMALTPDDAKPTDLATSCFSNPIPLPYLSIQEYFSKFKPRINKYSEKADEGALAFREDFQACGASIHHVGSIDLLSGNFAALTIPDALPDRVFIIGYICEASFVFDGM